MNWIVFCLILVAVIFMLTITIIYPIAHANAADIIETNNAGISVHVHINVCLLIVY